MVMVLLMHYNDRDALTARQLHQAVSTDDNFSISAVELHLKALLDQKILLLDDQTYQLNDNYQNQRTKFRITVAATPKETKDEIELTHQVKSCFFNKLHTEIINSLLLKVVLHVFASCALKNCGDDSSCQSIFFA